MAKNVDTKKEKEVLPLLDADSVSGNRNNINVNYDNINVNNDSKISQKVQVKRKITAKRLGDIDGAQKIKDICENVKIVGGTRAKKKLHDMLEKYRIYGKRYLEKGIKPTVGVIIYGIPGVGKSELAKQFSSAYADKYGDVKVVGIDPSVYLAKRLKGVEEIKKVFNRIVDDSLKDNKIMIVLIDECDALFPKRGKKSTGIIATERTDAILKIIDNIIDNKAVRGRLFIIGTTNLIYRIDPAIFRAGRFNKVSILLPNFEERLELSKLYLDNLDISVGNKTYKVLDIIDPKEVADFTVGFSGADFMSLQSELFSMLLDKEESRGAVHTDDIMKVIKLHSLDATNRSLMEIARFEADMKKIEEGSHVPKSMFEIDEV
jgi:SpoVK/Ycf46/Vps4 family AAA+-type ATPase